MANENTNGGESPLVEAAGKGGAIEFQKAGHTWKFWNPKPEYPGCNVVIWEFAVDGKRQAWKAHLAGDTFRFQTEIQVQGVGKVGGVRIPDRNLAQSAQEMREASIQESRRARDRALAEFRAGKVPAMNNPAIQEKLAELDAEARAKAEADAKAKAEQERQNAEAIEEARRTGKAVYIRKVGFYEGNDEDEEGLVQVWEVAMPDGKIVRKDIPTH